VDDLTPVELLKTNSSPLVLAYLDETSVYPYTVPGGTHTISIINNDSLELTYTVILKSGKVLTSVVPGQMVYNGKFASIDTIDITGGNFNVELGGV